MATPPFALATKTRDLAPSGAQAELYVVEIWGSSATVIIWLNDLVGKTVCPTSPRLRAITSSCHAEEKTAQTPPALPCRIRWR